MDDFLDNWFGSIYIGNVNPETEEGSVDYRREPTDLVDAAALEHDKIYDKVDASGLSGVLSKKTLDADLLLIARAEQVIRDYPKAKIDPYTNRPISKFTYTRAVYVKQSFLIIARGKIAPFKNPPKMAPVRKSNLPKKSIPTKKGGSKSRATNPPIYPKSR